MSDLADAAEKNVGSHLSPEKASPDAIIDGNARSKNFVKRLLQAPCGDSPRVLNYITLIISALLIWALLYTLLHHEVKPGGRLFALIVLTISSYFCGWLVSLVRLPPLLGMLLCGIALRNIGFFNMTGVYTEIVVTIREIALSTILLKAGLGLDASALKKLSFVVARLAFTPCFTEAAGAAVAAHVLMGMPWMLGLLLGFVLSAVSPAVVVPTLLSLKERGYGESKGISTLVIAASSIDDIIAISGFGVILGLVFSKGDIVSNIIQGPVEVAIGIAVGFGWGFIAACFPHRNEEHLVFKRSFMVGGGGLVSVLGSNMIGYSGSGPLATIILSFLASLCWKWQGWSNTYNPVAEVYSTVWIFLQPLLFGLIGTEIKFTDIDMQLIWQGLAILGFGLIVRIITCCVVLIGANLNWKEILFVNLAWLPKATVQAALGPVALDLAKSNKRPDVEPWAKNVLTIAVISILITAPIGAVGISLGGPRLLSNEPVPNKKYKKDKQIEVAVVEDQM